MSDAGRAQRTTLVPRTLGGARQQGLIAAAVIAGAVGVCAAIDAWLSGRVSAGTDTAPQLAPLYPYIGVDRTYVLGRALGMTALLTSALAVAVGLAVAGRRQTLSGAWRRPLSPAWRDGLPGRWCWQRSQSTPLRDPGLRCCR